jgi:protein TonB
MAPEDHLAFRGKDMRVLQIAVLGAACISAPMAATAQTAVTPGQATVSPPDGSKPIPRISSGLMEKMTLTKVPPEYPSLAREQHIQGTVTLHVIVGTDGHVERLQAISGPRELWDAAVEAVSQWTYKPYLLNGAPSRVDTLVIINFRLSS